jgi:tRNA threonylcarbamoyladenosine biosynthesis protein TsaB
MTNNTAPALALELSQRTGSIAVRGACSKTITREVISGKRDDDDVMPAIESAMEELDIQPADIEFVIVSIGPGGFTGLRTATTIAKMISFATGATIIPVPSAIVVAVSSDSGSGPFLVISSVKKEDFWLSRVEFKQGEWVCSAGLTTAKELATEGKGVRGVFADEFLPTSAKRYFEKHHIQVNEAKMNAASLLEAGLRLEATGQSVTPLDLRPMYPREPVAVQIWNTGQSR